MPAARHISRSPCIALAVIATMRGRSAGGQRRSDAARGLEAVHLRHLHVHQHHVVGLALDRLDRLDAVATRGRRGSPSAAAGAARASGSRRCPRRAGCAAGGARPCSGSSCGFAGAPARPCGAASCAEQADQRVEQLRLAHRLGEVGAEQRLRSSPASRRPSELNSTSGSVGRRCADALRERDAVHLRHVHVEDREVERLARRRASAAPPPATRWRAAAMPHLRGLQRRARGGWWRCRRRPARACPASSGCAPTKSRRRAGGSSASGASIVKWKVEPLPGPVALAPTCARPSARRAAC